MTVGTTTRRAAKAKAVVSTAKGAKAKSLDIVSAMNHPGLFGPWFQGARSWNGWRVVLKGAFGLPMTDQECEFFRTIAERTPPTKQVRELWIIAGRRAGKDSIASLIVAHAAALFDQGDRLRPGERALCMALACDRDQAKIVLNYTRSYFADIAPLKSMVTRETSIGFELSNGVDIAVGTNNFRSVRGRPILCSIFDECAFWRDENSASPDTEVYDAIRPGQATMPGSMLIGISTPYRKSGLLFKKYRDHFGRDGDDILVIKAPSILLNPTLDQAIIDQAMADDPAAARAEWMAEFRVDIESFIDAEVVAALVVPDRRELPPIPGVTYRAFTDPSGGSSDSYTVCVAHREGDRGVLDAIRERRPPFSPDDVTAEFATLLKRYNICEVHGDRYGGEFPRELFKQQGIRYEVSEKSKSSIYQELLPVLNSGRCELLDHPRLVAQLCGLERRTARGGRQSIDHQPNSKDDVANACAGALVLVAGKMDPLEIWRRCAA